MLLTQQGGMLGPFSKLMGWIMEAMFNLLDKMGIGNIGLTIILFTVVIRLILLPMTVKQQKFSKMTQLMQPEMKQIQKKYRGKKDQASMAKQNEEIQDLYAKYGVSPSGSCLQMFIQLPIMLALYRVMYNIPAYIRPIKQLFTNIIAPIQNVPGYVDKLVDVQESAKITQSAYIKLFEKGVEPTTNQMVDVMNKFGSDAWDKLGQAFSNSPEVAMAISENVPKIQEYNQFIFGINLTETPWSAGLFSAYTLIPIASALFSFLTSYSSMKKTQMDPNDPSARMTKGMMLYMPLMSAFIAFTVPAGLGLYWAIGSLVMWILQILVDKYLDHMDVDKFIEKNRAKAEAKAAKGKKSFMQKMAEAEARQAGVQEETEQRSISEIASISTKKILSNHTMETSTGKSIQDLDSPERGAIKQGSIASKANIMLSYESNKSENKGGK